ncbi:YceI family protein [Moheibacter sediminis]|uniref:Polyisoprenoid-binding protein YceI n=1 Tax=Moheibacter sediminis TaxID=1434700 RepID=A0A1W2BGE6_9FLAO|nr:YceI family protein [Moheibacter sediminis]SMC72057.1 Polyisoprenoid-binding protein YceI [Moheibacter sediminis]
MKLLSALLILFVSFGLNAQNKKIDTSKSSIHWVGKKITGQHDGTLDFKDGTLVFDGKKLTGGSFTVDMTTISATDVEGKTKDKLDGHLKAEDFFGVDKHPTSKLDFKKIADKGKGVYTVTADMTIKGITNSVTFDITVKDNSATAKFNVDRTKYDIKYGSKSFFEGIGDRAINDEFELEVKLAF